MALREKLALPIRRVATLGLAVSFSFALSWCGTSNSDRGPAAQEDSSEKSLTSACGFHRGHVYLLSSMTANGERGWLFCFDPVSKDSWLYLLPRIVKLQMEQSQSSGSIKLRSEAQPDGSTYILDVIIAERQVSGNLVIRIEPSTPDVQDYIVNGYRLHPPASGRARFPAGRYSSIRYMEETGDPVGTELLLFLTDKEEAGLIKFNESYWGEPQFVPLALSNIRLFSDHKLEFDLKLEDGEIGRYIATRKKDAIILHRVDVHSAPGAEIVRLPRQLRLLP
jgi:hypothetical protein